MRIPVFARGSNPAIDRPNQRKSESYGREEVEAGRADWVNPDDHAQGILCRAFFYQGQTLTPAQPEQVSRLSIRSALPPLEVHGSELLTTGSTKFADPEINLLKKQNHRCLIVRARAFARFCDLEVLAEA